MHRLIKEPDYLALPSLLKEGRKFELAYIDRMHSFEHTLLDLFYLDRMAPVGGVIGFNDCGMPAVQKVIRYLRSHLLYEEVMPEPVGWLQRRRLKFWEWPDQWFRKVVDRTVAWDFYADF